MTMILKSKIFFCKISPAKCRNRICGTLDFKISRGSMPPDPLRMARLRRSHFAPQNYDPGYATDVEQEFTSISTDDGVLNVLAVCSTL